VSFAGYQTHRKREKSARASPSPHHTSLEERTARFIAQPFPALVKTYRHTSAPLKENVRQYVGQPSFVVKSEEPFDVHISKLSG